MLCAGTSIVEEFLMFYDQLSADLRFMLIWVQWPWSSVEKLNYINCRRISAFCMPSKLLILIQGPCRSWTTSIVTTFLEKLCPVNHLMINYLESSNLLLHHQLRQFWQHFKCASIWDLWTYIESHEQHIDHCFLQISSVSLPKHFISWLQIWHSFYVHSYYLVVCFVLSMHGRFIYICTLLIINVSTKVFSCGIKCTSVIHSSRFTQSLHRYVYLISVTGEILISPSESAGLATLIVPVWGTS